MQAKNFSTRVPCDRCFGCGTVGLDYECWTTRQRMVYEAGGDPPEDYCPDCNGTGYIIPPDAAPEGDWDR